MMVALLGHNLVRLIYLDEAGRSRNEPVVCVAGVLVHGDYQSAAVEEEIEALVNEYVPPDDREDFFFHATDLYHGTKYFHRERWPRAVRNEIVLKLAEVIRRVGLPVVAGSCAKAVGHAAEPFGNITDDDISQTIAAVTCIAHADYWLGTYSPTERGMVVAEDTDKIKRLLKGVIRGLRSRDFLSKHGAPPIVIADYDLPLKRIVDTVHFAAKPDAKALQLADLCAFTFGRALKNLPFWEDVGDILKANAAWIAGANSAAEARVAAISTSSGQSS